MSGIAAASSMPNSSEFRAQAEAWKRRRPPIVSLLCTGSTCRGCWTGRQARATDPPRLILRNRPWNRGRCPSLTTHRVEHEKLHARSDHERGRHKLNHQRGELATAHAAHSTTSWLASLPKFVADEAPRQEVREVHKTFAGAHPPWTYAHSSSYHGATAANWPAEGRGRRR